jgi:hypothetical protein
MDLTGFRASLAAASPPPGLGPALRGLWWQGRGDWDAAHHAVQDADDRDSAWVHAHLHRVEGDPGNAGYWYRRAGRPTASGDLEAEWAAIAAALLG